MKNGLCPNSKKLKNRFQGKYWDVLENLQSHTFYKLLLIEKRECVLRRRGWWKETKKKLERLKEKILYSCAVSISTSLLCSSWQHGGILFIESWRYSRVAATKAEEEEKKPYMWKVSPWIRKHELSTDLLYFSETWCSPCSDVSLGTLEKASHVS